MMEMLSESKSHTISSPPSGFKARLTGVRPTSSSANTLSLVWVELFLLLSNSMEATWEDPEQATKALLESGIMAISSGCWHTGKVERTRSSLASITDTVLSPRFDTTRVAPSGETRASPGPEPTRTLPRTTRFSKSMTETLADPEFATYARFPSSETSMKYGLPWTPIVATAAFFSASITLMLFEPVLTT